MNAFKKNGGFTLVELIIVIAILAILSSVAVAGYSSYITKANDTAAEAWLSELVTQATLANAEAGAIGAIYVDVSDDGKTVAVYVEATSFDDAFPDNIAYGATEHNATCWKLTNVKAPSALFNSKYKVDAKWENGTWTVGKVTVPAATSSDKQ